MAKKVRVKKRVIIPGNRPQRDNDPAPAVQNVSVDIRFHRDKYKTPLALVVRGQLYLLNRIKGLEQSIFGQPKGKVEMPLTPLSMQYVLDAFPGAMISVEAYNWYQAEKERRKFMHQEMVKSSSSGYTNLYPHQEAGVAFVNQTVWGHPERNFRCMIADDMRLGKTIQTITAIRRSLLEDQYVFPILVLCPKSLMLYWQEQFNLWGPEEIETIILEGPVKNRLELMRSFSRTSSRLIMISNTEFVREAFLNHKVGTTFNVVNTLIIDECHSIRNRKSKLFNSIKKVKAGNIILLSATPTEHGPQDYFSYLNLLQPAKFRSYWNFVQSFCHVTKSHFGHDIGEPKNQELLRDYLKPIILRREAQTTVSVPEKIYRNIPLQTSTEFKDIYGQIKKETAVAVNELDSLTMPNILTRLTRLRQFAAHPPLLGFTDIHSPKLEALIEFCKNHPNDSLVVYCSFREAIAYIYSALYDEGISADIYEGDDQTIQDFQDREFQVFLSTPQMGVGINLSVSSTIIYYDLPWPATTLRQSMERTTTMSKTEPQMIISYVAADIDRIVADTLVKKQNFIRDADICYEIEKSFL